MTSWKKIGVMVASVVLPLLAFIAGTKVEKHAMREGYEKQVARVIETCNQVKDKPSSEGQLRKAKKQRKVAPSE